MRSYRGPNGENHEESYGPAAYFLGPRQVAWLKRGADELARDLEGHRRRHADRADPGLRSGPQLGQRRHRAGRRRRRADASSRSPTSCPSSSAPASATRCGSPPTCISPPRTTSIPNKAVFQDFEPFWEFVSGPIHAGTGIPGRARQHVRAAGRLRQRIDPGARAARLSPAYGLQFFGHVAIDGATEVMTVTLKDVADNALWSRKLEPKLG